MNSDDPYRQPVLYDLEYAHQRDDLVFYTALAKRTRGSYLELGCGNGRLSIPMARQGARVHGVDASPQMLVDFKEKASRELRGVQERLSWQEGDFRALDLKGQLFDTVIWPFNALHHCKNPDDLRAVLAGAKAALKEGGTMFIDCYLPDRVLYDRDPALRYEERTFTDPRDGRSLYSWEECRWDEETKIHHVYYIYQRQSGYEERLHLELRMFEHDELAEIIDQSGFRLSWQASAFGGAPMTPTSLKWIMELVPR